MPDNDGPGERHQVSQYLNGAAASASGIRGTGHTRLHTAGDRLLTAQGEALYGLGFCQRPLRITIIIIIFILSSYIHNIHNEGSL